MSAPDPNDFSLLAKLIGAASAILAPFGAVLMWVDGRYAKKHAVASQFQDVKNELAIQRQMIRDSEQQALRRHEELLMHLLKDRQ
jgi:hypothetical protein